MAYKDLLLELSSYPEATPLTAAEQAVAFADLLGARLAALTFEVDIHVPANPLANAILDIPGMVATERAKSVADARELLGAFEKQATKRNVICDRMVERTMTSHIPAIVTEHARLHDLTLIPIESPQSFQEYIAECVIFGSGRPVIVFPAAPKRPPGIRLDTVGIAWDFSRPAARAVADALPLLQCAKTVRVVTVTNEKSIDTRRSGTELARHLACHGVDIVLEEEDAAGRTISQALEAYANSHRLDLLVMGAYGHSRIRDFVLGGATKSVIADPPLPVLLSH